MNPNWKTLPPDHPSPPSSPTSPEATLPPGVEEAIRAFGEAQRGPAKYRPTLGAHATLVSAIRAALAAEKAKLAGARTLVESARLLAITYGARSSETAFAEWLKENP